MTEKILSLLAACLLFSLLVAPLAAYCPDYERSAAGRRYYLAARDSLQIDDVESAFIYLERLLAENPRHVSGFALQIALLAEYESVEQSATEIRDKLRVYNELCFLLAALNEVDFEPLQLLQLLDFAREQGIASGETVLLRVENLLKIDSYQQAFDVSVQALESHRQQARFYLFAGKAGFKLGDDEPAHQYFQKYFKLRPGDPSASMWLARSYYRRNELERARLFFDRWQALDTESEDWENFKKTTGTL